ncbi:hypothetical protein [Mycolicibacterium palauense]|uniref:hypothetical protein n=1 Tax=Mycolicibacterium palauense TaxID=2034511 RepID=UPI000BFEDF18|nr:hypothetical protein [Mycolicibacterium palauense]
MHTNPVKISRRTRAAAAALSLACLVAGCSRSIEGQVAQTTEPVSADVTCSEFVALSDKDRVEVISKIMNGDEPSRPSEQPFFLVALAGVLCERAPDAKVKDILVRLRPR